jgi:hypothetical protein
MALDGTTLEVADTPANARAFGRPGSGREAAAFPQLRAVALIETGTHALCDVVLRPSRCGDVPAGLRLLRSVGPGMLLLWDRNFHSFEMVRATLAHQAHCPGRTKANVVLKPTELLSDGSFLAGISPNPTARRHDRDGITVRVIEYALDTPAGAGQEKYRLVTSLLDERAFPADQLAAAYHERWEIETALDEVKVHHWAHPRPLRSQHPREVVQEVYGVLLAHLAIRTFDAPGRLPTGDGPPPTEFHGCTAGAPSGHPPRSTHLARGLPPFCDHLLKELDAERLPPRRPRQNPRAVKRKMSNFPRKRPPSTPAPPLPALPPTVRILWP